MPEINEQDALNLARQFYNKRFRPEETNEIIPYLIKLDVVELVKFVYAQGVIDTKGELNL